MVSHTTIYTVLQLHVVKTNHIVKNGLRYENKLNIYRNAWTYTMPVIKFMGLSLNKQTNNNKKKQTPLRTTLKYFTFPVNFLFGKKSSKKLIVAEMRTTYHIHGHLSFSLTCPAFNSCICHQNQTSCYSCQFQVITYSPSYVVSK